MSQDLQENLLAGKQPEEEENYDDFLSDFDVAKLLVVGSKNIFWVFLIMLCSTSGAFIFIRYTKNVYESSSIIKLESKKEAQMLGLSEMGASNNQSKYTTISGEIELIRSRRTLEKAVKKMKTDVSYYVVGKILTEEMYKKNPFQVLNYSVSPGFYDFQFGLIIINDNSYKLSYQSGDKEISSTYEFGKIVSTPDFTFRIIKAPNFSSEFSNQKFYFTINSQESQINYINKSLRVDILNLDAQTLKISFTDFDKIKAADIVNTIDTVYLEETIQNKILAHEQTLRFLDSTLANTEKNLSKYELELEKFVGTNKTLNVQGDFSKTIEKIEGLDKDLLNLKIQISLIEDLKKIVSTSQDLDLFLPSMKYLEDQQLVESVNLLKVETQELVRLRGAHKQETFVIQAQQNKVEHLRNGVIDLANQNIKILEKTHHDLISKSDQLNNLITELPSKETQLTRLKRFYTLYEKFYLMLIERQAEFGIAKAGAIPNFVILSPALINSVPIYPNKFFHYATGLGVGFFLSIVLVFFKYFLHNTISTQREIEKSVKAPILGGIPEYKKEKLEVSKLIVDKNAKSMISESLRSIRTNLEFITAKKKKRLISITSTVSGEGKTFVTVNLAGVIAWSGQKVIVLDLDMRKPKVHIAFEKENLKGMSTILIGRHTFEECINESVIPNLHFISAGPTPPNPSELILRPELDALLEKLFELYDVIIVDTPPVGLVTDGVLILKKSDLPIYVIRANYSQKGVKRNINKLIKTAGLKNLSVILNAMKSVNSYGYGNYGYDYRNEYGYYDSESIPRGWWYRLKNKFLLLK